MTRNSYTQKLAEWAMKRPAAQGRHDRHTVAFLAVRADVEAAIGAGYSVRTVWEHLREMGKVTCRYESFLRHVRIHIRQNKVTPGKAVSPGTAQVAGSGAPPARRDLAGFTFNPAAKKEDLL